MWLLQSIVESFVTVRISKRIYVANELVNKKNYFSFNKFVVVWSEKWSPIELINLWSMSGLWFFGAEKWSPGIQLTKKVV